MSVEECKNRSELLRRTLKTIRRVTVDWRLSPTLAVADWLDRRLETFRSCIGSNCSPNAHCAAFAIKSKTGKDQHLHVVNTSRLDDIIYRSFRWDLPLLLLLPFFFLFFFFFCLLLLDKLPYNLLRNEWFNCDGSVVGCEMTWSRVGLLICACEMTARTVTDWQSELELWTVFCWELHWFLVGLS